MALLIFYLFIFSSIFYIIARNQLDFDNLTELEVSKIKYRYFYEALIYVQKQSLGDMDTSAFELGESSQMWLLYIMYMLITFIMAIHFLNMLIAIMGNTFAERTDCIVEAKMSNKLMFIIQNWDLMNFALGDRKKHRYIVAAFHHLPSS